MKKKTFNKIMSPNLSGNSSQASYINLRFWAFERFSFCNILNDQGLSYQQPAFSSAENTYLNLNYSGYHKNLIQ